MTMKQTLGLVGLLAMTGCMDTNGIRPNFSQSIRIEPGTPEGAVRASNRYIELASDSCATLGQDAPISRYQSEGDAALREAGFGRYELALVCSTPGLATNFTARLYAKKSQQ
ncbi:hypothetical protein HYV86_01070 [Candidatus Woesearchaeota archaeon]|nr:hypothetical protein [Candidatus Woesearchaeota archaeon]